VRAIGASPAQARALVKQLAPENPR
jgi:hypothetical protein